VLNTSRLVALPPASPPSAGRAVGAVWTGTRAYQEALRDVLEALLEAGAGHGDLTFLLRAEPQDADPVTTALRGLGVEPERIARGPRLPEAPVRMDPELGPCLTLRRRSRGPVFAHCDGRCTCGCHVSVAHIQFVERRRTAGRVAPLRHPLFEMIVSEHALTHGPRAGSLTSDEPRQPVPPLLGPLIAGISELLAGVTGPEGPSPVFLADASSAASLLLGEGMAPGPRGGPYVLRRLIRMVGTELAVHGVPPALLTSVMATAELAFRAPLGFPRLSARSWVHMTDERDAFLKVLSKGRGRVMRPGVLSDRPWETATQLMRLRSERGVPLALSLRWCREAGMELTLVHLALADLWDTARPAPPPGTRGVT
jgi:alanyl-tRNA synthetase